MHHGVLRRDDELDSWESFRMSISKGLIGSIDHEIHGFCTVWRICGSMRAASAQRKITTIAKRLNPALKGSIHEGVTVAMPQNGDVAEA